ncbi:hypothetical protein Pcinc_018050 [Petrolisthes cinctipes]|uniref:Fibronectin type-III domain-containing protein n=1 Tax=Petrolisthes cinctipes TaxID=88211 RepID=A0AAE1KN65_PETCI|nr:hypothetical protein Pcinc_018050 [Petrolisthes cinctipes]
MGDACDPRGLREKLKEKQEVHKAENKARCSLNILHTLVNTAAIETKVWVMEAAVVWVGVGSVMAVWAAGGGVGGERVTSTACPTWEENPWCPCYQFDDGVFLECPMVSLATVGTVLSLVRRPVKSLSIYDLDTNVTSLSPGVFTRSAGVTILQISQSNLQHIGDSGFRGLENSLQSLTIMHSKLTSVPQAALQRLSRLKSLDLEANNITELQSYSFFNMNLHTLNLKGNGIKLISEYAFDGLEKSLEELNLMNNKLKQLPIPALRRLSKLRTLKATWNLISDVVSDGYSRLPSLHVLDLSSNRFTELSSSSLATMPALVSLLLYMNDISYIAGDTFIHNSDLQSLYLSHNNIMSLATETFTYTLYIRVIDLGDNHLHSLSDGLFSNLPELQELFLNNNNLLKIRNNTFVNATKLSVLYLQDNEIHSIESGTFANTEILSNLQLSSNNLAEIPVDLFSTTRSLNSLSLDNNKLNILLEGTFASLIELRELRLQNNRLSSVERSVFSPLPNLLELHLQNNVIEFIAKEAFSSLSNLQHLNLEGNKITEVPDSLSRYPASLITLNLSKNQINSIHADAFRDQTKLEIIWLNNNNVSTIFQVMLSDLSALKELYLENNWINNIMDRSFSAMNKLKKLNLSGNQMEHVNSPLFEGLYSLEKLYLGNNKIMDIEPQTFQKLKRLEELDLTGNEILVIRRYMFEGTIPLKRLNLQAASITDINPDSFTDLLYLEELNLKRNHLTRLNRTYLNVRSIKSLNLAENKFEIIDEDSLYSLPYLESLDLSGCQLPRLPPHLLAEASELKNLNLANNNFVSLTAALFQKMKGLRELDLSNNYLNNNIMNSLEGLVKLEVLKLDLNPLNELTGSLRNMDGLRELHLSGTELTRMENTVFIKLRQLKKLDLSNNNLTVIPPGIFANLSLEKLSLADNFFTQIPNSLFLDGMPELRVLNMSGNPLQRVTGLLVVGGPPLAMLENLVAARTNLTLLTSHDFLLTPNLHSLNLAHAAIGKISPGCFRNLTYLQHLNLGHNHLEILPRERLRGLKSLTHLNLTNNNLKKLDQLPSGAQSLKILDASGNTLTELLEFTFKHGAGIEDLLLGSNWITSVHPRSLVPLKNLRHLDLSNNNLEGLNTAALEPVERSLRSVELGGNPWNCGCEVSHLWSWLQDHLSRVPTPSTLICDRPKTLSGLSFLLLSSSSFCPQPVILRLAIQDIQSQSLLVSWQATNSSAVYGFKVWFQVTVGEDGRVLGGLNTRSLPASSRTYLLGDLLPGTNYMVCVQGLTTSVRPVSRARPHTYLEAPYPSQPPDMDTKCTRVRTLEQRQAQVVLNNRLAIIIGVSLGIFIFVLTGAIVCCCQLCKSRREQRKPDPPPTQDYLSYRHFSIPDRHSSIFGGSESSTTKGLLDKLPAQDYFFHGHFFILVSGENSCEAGLPAC